LDMMVFHDCTPSVWRDQISRMKLRIPDAIDLDGTEGKLIEPHPTSSIGLPQAVSFDEIG
jgi:hypothetical protein